MDNSVTHAKIASTALRNVRRHLQHEGSRDSDGLQEAETSFFPAVNLSNQMPAKIQVQVSVTERNDTSVILPIGHGQQRGVFPEGTIAIQRSTIAWQQQENPQPEENPKPMGNEVKKELSGPRSTWPGTEGLQSRV